VTRYLKLIRTYFTQDHLFEAGVWVWIIAVLVRTILQQVQLQDLWKANTTEAYIMSVISSQQETPTASPTAKTSSASVQLQSPGRSRTLTDRFIPPASGDVNKRRKVAIEKDVYYDTGPQATLKSASTSKGRKSVSGKSRRKMLATVTTILSADCSPSELARTIKEGKLSTKFVDIDLTTLAHELHHEMKVSTAARRQHVLTDQYLQLAAFPGYFSHNSLFFSNEFWFSDAHLRAYFVDFNVKWHTPLAQVVMSPLFGLKQCFHLQMTKDYDMPYLGDAAWIEASKAWSENCCLDR
jgi:hypothetical protein